MVTATLLLAAVALPPLMPVDEIKPGQKGECLTVFEGDNDNIEPFSFVVKDVMPNFLGPGQDLVLAKLEGEKAEFTGVVAGMSGSPCSIDGRLVGALAYSFAMFAKEPIAGITPMKSMLDVMKLPAEERPWRMESRSKPRARTDTGDDWDAMASGAAIPAPVTKGLVPIATPLTLGGVVSEVREHFTPWLESRGFLPVAGSSGSRVVGAHKLKPGSAVAAVLVRGDVDIAGTGTVTSVEGDEVLAFGHPFLGVGAVSVPMATAHIHNTMASAMRSFKMSGTGETVGEFTQDRLTAIGGYLGRRASMIPVKGTLRTPNGPSDFSFEVARDSMLSPRFVAVGLSNALSGRIDTTSRGIVRIKGSVKAKGLEPVSVRSVYSASRDQNLLVHGAIDVARNFATLWDTPFGAPPALEVTLDAEVFPEPFEEYIEALHVDRGIVQPGKSIGVAVRLRRNDGPVSIERFELSVPRSWAGQMVDVVATGVRGAEQMFNAVGGNPRPKNLKQVAQWLRGRRGDGYVYFMVIRSGAGMQSDVDVMPFLPGSAVATLSGAPAKQTRAKGIAWEERRERPGVVIGGVVTPIKVMEY